MVTNKNTGRLIYAASESSADLLYATGFMAPDPFLWLDLGDERLMVVSPLEIGRAEKIAGADVHVMSHAAARLRWNAASAAPEVLVPAIAEAAGIQQLTVPADFPFGLALELQKQGLVLRPSTVLFPERQIKDVAETDAIIRGIRLAEAGLQRALTILRESIIAADGVLHWNGAVLSAEAVAGEINAEIARLGGTAAHTIVAPGPQGADPHESGHGPLHANEPVVIDIFPRVDATGYHGDLTRTVVKGDAPQHVREAYVAVNEARAAAIAAAAPGAEAGKVHAVAVDVLETHGFMTDAEAQPPRGFFHGTGHGLGLEVHEAPRVSKASTHVFEAGNVVTIEPGLYYPEWGGIRIEDVIVITDSGCRNLTTAEYVLEIS